MNNQPTTPQPMTDNNHPITPPRELVAKWITEGRRQGYFGRGLAELVQGRSYYVADQSARWGYEQRGAVNEAELQKVRDEELEACCEEIRDGAGRVYIDESKLRVCLADDIWTARRPKPNSQAEEALEALSRFWAGTSTHDDWELVRSSLERLRELEALHD